eukprot:2189180-Pyramimonas_sp.AAC.1
MVAQIAIWQGPACKEHLDLVRDILHADARGVVAVSSELVWRLTASQVNALEHKLLQSFAIHRETSAEIDARCPSPLRLHEIVAHKHGVVAVVYSSVDVALKV